jgi:hypothetical protein
MANVKISDLTAAAAATSTQQFEVNDSAASKSVTGAQIKSFVKDGLVASDITDLTASVAELNILDGATLSTSELNYVDGVTSAIQTQLDAKAPSAAPTLSGTITITGGTQSWTVIASGTNLTFAYNGTNKMRLDSSGNLTVVGNVTAYGTL